MPIPPHNKPGIRCWIAAAPDPGSYTLINDAPTVVNPIADVDVDEDAPNSARFSVRNWTPEGRIRGGVV